MYIGDYTTQFYGDDNKDPYETTSISMESKAVFYFSKKTCSLWFLKIWPVQKALELAILFKSMGFLLGGSGPRYRKCDHPHL